MQLAGLRRTLKCHADSRCPNHLNRAVRKESFASGNTFFLLSISGVSNICHTRWIATNTWGDVIDVTSMVTGEERKTQLRDQGCPPCPVSQPLDPRFPGPGTLTSWQHPPQFIPHPQRPCPPRVSARGSAAHASLSKTGPQAADISSSEIQKCSCGCKHEPRASGYLGKTA